MDSESNVLLYKTRGHCVLGILDNGMPAYAQTVNEPGVPAKLSNSTLLLLVCNSTVEGSTQEGSTHVDTCVVVMDPSARIGWLFNDEIVPL